MLNDSKKTKQPSDGGTRLFEQWQLLNSRTRHVRGVARHRGHRRFSFPARRVLSQKGAPVLPALRASTWPADICSHVAEPAKSCCSRGVVHRTSRRVQCVQPCCASTSIAPQPPPPRLPLSPSLFLSAFLSASRSLPFPLVGGVKRGGQVRVPTFAGAGTTGTRRARYRAPLQRGA